ncbi:Predicted arabinose efflux permease, MFS family [Sphingomonas palmae]|uniref:Predicted arabinose efflux permease, MFS family n=1 Tax=Sphingomonas palmae TaxID=1855283 RepID=A0A1H7T3P9_9SPHN|nr:MFS transporter [Sphingomonas palmae]SEL79348.1 Predicted arabinose efflux permease, MFS family [Sphingomonas palmae]
MTTRAVPARDAEGPWYHALDRKQWNTLIASNLGWLFDGFENYALILTVAPALSQLLPRTELADLPFYIGSVIAINLLGWAIGGLLGGVLADYIGRKRMMMYAIIGYSVATGLSAFAFSWWSFAALRFIVGVTVGSEWATGSSMMAELWPDRARGKGAGLMQCGLGIGFFLASLVWLFVAPLGNDAWRYMYLLGVLPALITLWIRRAIPESELWEAAMARRAEAKARENAGRTLSHEDQQLTKFTLVDLFTDRAARRVTVLALFMSLATTVGFWSISTWVPQFVGSLATAEGLQAARWASFAGMAYTAGSITGYVAFGFLADALGRKPVTFAFFLIALLLTPVLFFGTKDLTWLLALAFLNAIFSNGQYTWMPVWLPELFPTRMRGTALAVIFNLPRFIAFAGPLLAGTLIVTFGGFGWAAVVLSSIYVVGMIATPFLPETRGKPLPL